MIRDIFIETPWWVYVLFAFLVALGLKAVRPRTIPFYRLILLPAVFALWNILWLADRIQGHISLFTFWLVGLLIGTFFGWISVRHWKVRVNRERKSISLPGNWSTLVLILLVFIIRYTFIYNYETHPETAFHLFKADALISGVITGAFIGRAIELYLKYRYYSSHEP